MAEEHRCEAPEGHRLCANNCGFFGSPTTMNLCSKCYTDIRLKDQQHATTKSSIETALSSATSSPPPPPPPSSSSLSSSPATGSLSPPPPPPALTLPEVAGDVRILSVQSGVDDVAAVSKPNRCFQCRKRVGLTGFQCRCGTTFCGVHRYPEKHACTFDFKKVGREEIARANPLVIADKLQKI